MINQKEDTTIVRLDQIRFKTTTVRSRLCDYSDAYILVQGTITVANTAAAADAAVNDTNKKVIFKNCALFTDCITEINNMQIDDTQKTGIVMHMCSNFKSFIKYYQ